MTKYTKCNSAWLETLVEYWNKHHQLRLKIEEITVND